MIRCLFFNALFFSSFIFSENAGFIEKSSVGLFIDASYSPAWRSKYPNDVILRKNADFLYDLIAAGIRVDSTPIISSGQVGSSGFSKTTGWDVETSAYIFTDGMATVGYWGDSLFSMEDFKNHFSNGLRVKADISANRETSAQISYVGLYQWNDYARVVSPTSNIRISIHPYIFSAIADNIKFNLFDQFASIDLFFKEKFNSIELNAFNHSSARYYDYFSVGFCRGIRGIEYNNDLLLYGETKGVGDLLPPIYKDILMNGSVRNRNRFIGAQVGLSGRYRVTRRIFMYVPIKAGLYADLIHSKINILYQPTPASSGIAPEGEKTLLNLIRKDIGLGVSAETTPAIEVHVGKMYFYVAASFLYLLGTSPAGKQLADTKAGVFKEQGDLILSAGSPFWSAGNVYQNKYEASTPNNFINKPVDSGYFYLTGISVGGGLHF